jgi:DNA polymerase-4
VTDSVKLFGSGEEIAEKIRKAVKEETGLTVSIGVSFNRAFAKLASEIKKPDAVTVVSKENYKKIVYPLPVGKLMMIGKNTAKTLGLYGIRTIGDLAETKEELLLKLLGKRGRQVRVYARGEDDTPVGFYGEEDEIKSIGNSMTLPHDVSDLREIKRLFFVLAESVSARLREADIGKCDTVHITVKDEYLRDSGKQKKIPPTALCQDIANAAYELYLEHCPAGFKAHLLGIAVSGFDHHVEQMRLDGDASEKTYEKRQRAENAVAKIREKYGYEKLQRGIVMEDESLIGLDIKGIKE